MSQCSWRVFTRGFFLHQIIFRRGDSRRKESRLGAGKVIELQREEIKLNEAENAWKPSKKEAGEDVVEDDVEVLCKKIRSILNKLCPQKFDKLVAQFKARSRIMIMRSLVSSWKLLIVFMKMSLKI